MDYTIIDHYLGERMKELRIKRGLTVEGAANKIGLKKGTYYYYETGKRSMPMEVLISLSELYGVNYIELFEEAQKVFLNSLKCL